MPIIRVSEQCNERTRTNFLFHILNLRHRANIVECFLFLYFLNQDSRLLLVRLVSRTYPYLLSIRFLLFFPKIYRKNNDPLTHYLRQWVRRFSNYRFAYYQTYR